MDPRSDGQLVLLSREDPDAFAEFYDRHAEEVLRYLARRTLDPDVAAELTAARDALVHIEAELRRTLLDVRRMDTPDDADFRTGVVR